MKMNFPAVIHEYPTRRNLHLFGKVKFPGIALKVLRNIYMRNRLGESQNWRCCWCGVECIAEPGQSHSATIEHVTPRSLGGQNHWDNYAMACAHCNNKRGTQSVEDFMAGRVPVRASKEENKPNRRARLVAKRMRKYRRHIERFNAHGWKRNGNEYCPDRWLESLCLPDNLHKELLDLVEGRDAF